MDVRSTWWNWGTALLRMNLYNFLVQAIEIRLLILNQAFWFVKVILGSHSTLCLWTGLTLQSVTAAFVCGTTSGRTPSIRSTSCLVIRRAEIVEVIKHQIHILLFLTLQMMDDSLIFMNLDSNVRVCLPRNSPRLYKTASLLIHIIAALCCRNIVSDIGIQSLLSSSHWLIVEFATLLLQLIVTNIECVTSEAMITHSHLVLLTVQMVDHIVVVLVVIINTSAATTTWDTTLITSIMIIPITHIIVTAWLSNVQTIVSLVVAITIGSIVLISI